jgi:ribosomal-protein-alanine N-acetyltransferase
MIIKPVQGGIFIKWLHPSLVLDVACLECYSCENFWTRLDFLDALKDENVGGYLATDINQPIGFLVYENFPDCVQISNMAMKPDYRRRGIASLMIEKVKGVSKALHLNKVTTVIRESNLNGHLFLQANGFVCEGTEKCYFVDDYEYEMEREDGYRFTFLA